MPEPKDEALIERARAQLGRVLKYKYRLDSFLGVGGMATVFAATHRNGNRVAVKLLHPELMLNKEALGRFLREGYAANKVEHRGTVRVLDDDNDDGAAFLVMELLEGETVQAISERSDGGTLEPERVLSLADQVLDVLAAAHDKGIVHRDIKPENLFLTTEGVLKVLDFGIARVRESTASVTVTKTGSPFGSPAYMAPEQALGRSREIDARTDIYSVGATMFTLLSGELVHKAESAQEMVVVTATKPARSLGSVIMGVPPEVVALVDRAISFDRRSRWQDARSMRQAVRETYESLYAAPLPAPPVGTGGPRSSSDISGPVATVGPSWPGPIADLSTTGPTAVGPAPAPKDRSPNKLAATELLVRVRPPSREAMTAPPTTTRAGSPRSRRKRWTIAATSVTLLGALALWVGVWVTAPTKTSVTATSAIPQAPPAAASSPAPADPSAATTSPPESAASSAPPSEPTSSSSAATRSGPQPPPRRPSATPRPHPKADPFGTR
jgi:eukaryotic-like serine/threonine-protein kinase